MLAAVISLLAWLSEFVEVTLLWPGVCQEVAEVNYIEGSTEYIDASNDFGHCLGNKKYSTL